MTPILFCKFATPNWSSISSKIARLLVVLKTHFHVSEFHVGSAQAVENTGRQSLIAHLLAHCQSLFGSLYCELPASLVLIRNSHRKQRARLFLLRTKFFKNREALFQVVKGFFGRDAAGLDGTHFIQCHTELETIPHSFRDSDRELRNSQGFVVLAFLDQRIGKCLQSHQ